MLGLAFHYEDFTKNIYSGRCPEDIDLWHNCAKSWGVTHMFMIDVTSDGCGTNYEHIDMAMEYKRYTDLSDLESEYSNVPIIYTADEKACAEKGILTNLLHEFVHPEGSAIYVMGRDSDSYMFAGRKDKTWVSVIGDTDGWSITYAAIVLHDRYVKERT